jgi:hypothetical protein
MPLPRLTLTLFLALIGLTPAGRTGMAQSVGEEVVLRARIRNHDLTGRVSYDPQTHGPIAAQVVLLSNAAGRPAELVSRTMTDSSGHFTLSGVAPGSYQLVVRAIGYSPARHRLIARASGPQALSIVLHESQFTLDEIAPPEPQEVGLPLSALVETSKSACPLPEDLTIMAIPTSSFAKSIVGPVDSFRGPGSPHLRSGAWALTLLSGTRAVAARILVVPELLSNQRVLPAPIRFIVACPHDTRAR